MAVHLRERRLRSGSIRLYLEINTGGRQYQEALGLELSGDPKQDREVRRMAKQVAAKRQVELDEARLGIKIIDRRKESFSAYYEALGAGKTNLNTRASWNNAHEHLREYAKHRDISFGELTRENIEGFRKHLLAEVSANSAQVYLSRIKSALYQAVKDGRISSSPAQFVTVRKEETLPRFLEFAEIQKLAETPCANVHVRNAFLFSCFTGLRYSDLKKLTWNEVKGGHLSFRQQKTGRVLRKKLAVQAKRILKGQHGLAPSKQTRTEHPEGTVFLLPRQSVVDKHLKAWGEAAKLEKTLSMHVARHSHATLLITTGTDIYTTSKSMGHKSLATTQRYAQVTDERLNESAKRLPTLRN